MILALLGLVGWGLLGLFWWSHRQAERHRERQPKLPPKRETRRAKEDGRHVAPSSRLHQGRQRRDKERFAQGVSATSRHACALGLFDGAATLGSRGVPIGPYQSTTGEHCYDPFELYAAGELQDPDMVVWGRKGQRKALDLETPIPTPTGWSTMGHLKIGDEVFSADGRPTRIIATSEVMDGECYRVRFSDGSVIIADADHLWVTETVQERRGLASPLAQPVTTRALAETVRWPGKLNLANHSVRVAAPLRLPEADLPIPPRLLGLWLGDGDSSGAGFTTADLELIEEFATAGVPVRAVGDKHPYRYRLAEEKSTAARRAVGCAWCGETIEPAAYRRAYCSHSCARSARWAGQQHEPRQCSTCEAVLPSTSWHEQCQECRRAGSWLGRLRALGVLGNKHIPPTYLRASVRQRRELLSGLVDTDGWATPAGQVAFTTTSARLAADVRELVCSLGYRASYREGRARLNGRDCGTAWTLMWTTADSVFGLKRKADTHAKRRRPSQGLRHLRRFIVEVVPVEPRPVRCIQVEHPSGMFLAGETMIPTHNSTFVKVYARRQWTCGRHILVIDPWGEYEALCKDVGGTFIDVKPGGGVYLNPLASPDDRHELLRAVARAALPRPLKPREPAALQAALDELVRLHPNDEPTLPRVIGLLFEPTDEMCKRLHSEAENLADEMRDLATGMLPLCEGDLAGMFDQPTSAEIDLENRFVVVSLRHLMGSASLGVMLACATAFMQVVVDRLQREAAERGGVQPKTIMVVDEAWRIFEVPGIAEWLQVRNKQSRKIAEQHVIVMHRLSDLDAAGDDGSRTTKLVRGLMEDMSTFVYFRIEADELDRMAETMHLSASEKEVLEDLQPGEALHKIAGRPFVVQTRVHPREMALVKTDHAMEV